MCGCVCVCVCVWGECFKACVQYNERSTTIAHAPRIVRTHCVVLFDEDNPECCRECFLKGASHTSGIRERQHRGQEYANIYIYMYINYHSKVWDHPENVMFSMKPHTLIQQLSAVLT